MDKLMMNKLDDMELDMVTGGAIKQASPTSNPNPENPFRKLIKGLKDLWNWDKEKPMPKPTPSAPPKPTIDPEEARRQYMKEMKDILNKQKPITDTWP
ncbi:hypothetical protein SAMN04487861_1271 [Selenomonas ruminantium]|uniref:Uncharacterized protein n=2 Tax=Selenomonas ruminantium TaxID=971 RepID=A0A1I3H3X9_SELRU|nr:hypothetical protein [Selenomonas ruminantium]SFI30257.1 hypothetical protein SAMN04487861_1271 [Selenomonas ruminantium]